ncbi:MAG: ABC transporter ATP-binding protein [Thermaerobacter sp.]|nr:ABC transporter ATP-binding protein [Thermaerobacter sp.]
MAEQIADAGGLEVRGLTKRFGDLLAVDGLSFAVRPGETVGLLGPNGAGKTTTLLCVAGLVRPSGGEVRWNGGLLGAERGRRVTLIAETPEVYAMLTVWEHLVFVARSCRLLDGWQHRGEELLERLGLSEQRDALGEALSKGMRQKTLIAASVLAGTPALLLDEPMIGLDPRGQRELRGMLEELRREGIALLISTHLLESAEAICDRVVIMKQGRLVAEGQIAELRQRRGSEETLEDAFLEITQ